MTFGQQLKKFRKIRNLSQWYVAQESGITQPWLSMVERGHNNPSLGLIERICKVLNCELKIVFKDDTSSMS